jgi:hypothetical protein
MPKLRNGATDLEKFTQWLGRKCRNHNPLGELKLSTRERAATPRMYKAKHKGDVRVVATAERNVLLYDAANRMFEVTVREVDPAEYEGVETVAVEY